jgi:hypothetical protein
MPGMIPALATLRRRLLGLAPWAALVLVCGLLAGAVHRHHDEGAPQHDHCAVCHVSHVKAVPAGASIAPARPTLPGSRLAPAPIDLPAALAGTIARGRAPPARG